MQKLIFSFIMLAIWVNAFATKDVTEQKFGEGKRLMLHNISAAKTKFLQLEKLGVKSSGLYGNLGTCFYNTGDFATALFYYQKALQLSPTDEELINNRYYAIAHLNLDAKNSIILFTQHWRNERLFNYASFAMAIGLCVCSLLYACLAFSGVAKWPGLKRLILYLIGFFSIGSIAAFGMIKDAQRIKYAVVCHRSTLSLRKGPSINAKANSTLNAGEIVQVEKRYNGWVKITCQDKKGWLYAKEANIKLL
jgi:tetratricopeptide (TPR) repeat protein